MQPPYKVLIWALVVQISKSLRTPLSASSDVHIHAYRNISANTSISNGGDPVTPQWLETGDPCNGTATFELGKEYYEAECPAINQFLPDGTCDWAMKQTEDTNCSFFCQVRTTFVPTEEVPIPNTYCRGPRRCSIPPGLTVQVASSWSGADAATSALEHGVSGGFDPSQQTVVVDGADVTIGEGECGYFTWIGTRKEVCGSLTLATRHEPLVSGGTPYCQSPSSTTGNYCADETYGGPSRNPSAYGHTVFVRIDCGTRLALPASAQDPLFQYAGVALDSVRLDRVLQDWVSTTCILKENFFYSSCSMHGRGLRDDDLGSSGIHLLEKMRACRAAVTGWTFHYTPDDNKFDWMASFSVDEFDTVCPGNALTAIGANSRDLC
ncbi:hypothetical protein F4825DRAFT_66823 [Nemania diffusa]|nr:hypothetical protein F4825DRAFT_66823 [Nemania diffusa]